MPGQTICLTVLGRERPGIVAAITGVLFDNDCNIRDSTMTILAGEFGNDVVLGYQRLLRDRNLYLRSCAGQNNARIKLDARDRDLDVARQPVGQQSGVSHHLVHTFGTVTLVHDHNSLGTGSFRFRDLRTDVAAAPLHESNIIVP